jgi:hypothetical protein
MTRSEQRNFRATEPGVKGVMNIELKRVYEPLHKDDGLRILVALHKKSEFHPR